VVYKQLEKVAIIVMYCHLRHRAVKRWSVWCN